MGWNYLYILKLQWSLLGMWLEMHTGIKVNDVSKRGTRSKICLSEYFYWCEFDIMGIDFRLA